MNRSQRKQLVKEIIAEIETVAGELFPRRSVISVFAQKRPYTFVEITYFDGPRVTDMIVGYGFTKVCVPDEWSPSYGRQLAIQKAAAHVVKQLSEQTRQVITDVRLPKVVTIEDTMFATPDLAQSG